MDLLSLEFIAFLIVAFIAYYLLSFINKAAKRVVLPQWAVLFVASLVFYGFTNYVYLIYLGVSSLVSYAASLLCQHRLFERIRCHGGDHVVYNFRPSRVELHQERRKYESLITALAILVNVGILAVLKYYNFFAGSVNSLLHLGVTTYNFIIPLGISFYTFSLIAYNVDCCKRVTVAEKNPLKFLLFVSYFPKILQGPISSYDKLKEDGLFDEHSFTDNDYLKSLFRISVGLIKKIAVANVLNLFVNASYANIGDSFGGGVTISESSLHRPAVL